MKLVWRSLGWGAAASALLIVGLLTYATARGRLTWFRSVRNVEITQDRKAALGRLHRSFTGKVFILTGRLPHESESYWIVLPGVRPGGAASCAGWSAPALRLFFISKLTPPCFFPIEKGSQGRTRPRRIAADAPV
jgi:hypothetical protein